MPLAHPGEAAAQYPGLVAEDELPTVVEGARAPPVHASANDTSGSSSTTSSSSGGASHTLGLTGGLGADTSVALDLPRPETVLRRAAFEQTRRTALSGMLFNGIGLIAAPLIGGDALAERLFLCAMVAGLLNNAALLRVCRSESRYRQRHAVLYFSVAPITNAAVLYYLGTFGPILVMFVLNVYTACLAYNRRVAQIVLAGAIAPFVVLGSLFSADLLVDPGLVTATGVVGPGGRAIMVAAFLLFLLLTYEQARHTREKMVASLVERDAAVRLASHREALVLEARQDLERALKAGGLGRFTDRTLGSYKLGAVIGRGGMGEVYDAKHVVTGEPAAVKMLLPEVVGRPEYVRRFLREVKIAASVDSPNVVRVFEIGDETAPMPYLAMERLSGEDLAQILRKEARLSDEVVVDMVRQIGHGLAAASAAGVVHRDLKPQNVFRTTSEPPIWKILDFGVSKLVGGEGATRGETIGTPRYMAPEQARGEPIDGRADLYSLAVVVYRTLTGNPPFNGDDIPVLVEVMTRMPLRPTMLTKLHPNVDAFFAVALAKKPGDRFQTAEELADALEAALAGRLSKRVRERAATLLEALPWADERGSAG